MEERDELFAGMVEPRKPCDRMIISVELRQAVQPSRVRLCPTCVVDRLSSRPVAAWHCVHRLPGVFVCPDHDSDLWDSGMQTERM